MKRETVNFIGVSCLTFGVMLFAAVSCHNQPASAHTLTKTCNGAVCTAVIERGTNVYVAQYALDNDGDVSDIDVLIPKDATRELVLAIKDQVVIKGE